MPLSGHSDANPMLLSVFPYNTTANPLQQPPPPPHPAPQCSQTTTLQLPYNPHATRRCRYATCMQPSCNSPATPVQLIKWQLVCLPLAFVMQSLVDRRCECKLPCARWGFAVPTYVSYATPIQIPRDYRASALNTPCSLCNGHTSRLNNSQAAHAENLPETLQYGLCHNSYPAQTRPCSK